MKKNQTILKKVLLTQGKRGIKNNLSGQEKTNRPSEISERLNLTSKPIIMVITKLSMVIS